MDLKKMTIQKLDFRLKERDTFESESYMYHLSSDGQTYLVAGRYHVHLFDKQTMQWDILTTGRVVQKSIADRRREQKLKSKLDVASR
jgi:hypothetical protein